MSERRVTGDFIMSVFVSREMGEVGPVEPSAVEAQPASGVQPRLTKQGSRDAVDEAVKTGEPSPATMEWRDAVIALLPRLRAFAWSLSHNSADADDLVQDTLIKAWTNKDKFEPGTNLRAWLFTILRNTYYTAVVKRRREVADEDGKYAARLSTAPTQEWSVAMKTMQVALQQLPPEHREALILVGAAGVTYEEAAEICGCALGTIKSRVNRARARLLQIMDAKDATDAMAGVTASPQPQRGEI
jgi:RNA polymerase sigma-70 factor (ECF subfamily)